MSTFEKWDEPTGTDIFEELRNIDVHIRLNGNRWLKFVDDLAMRYGVEPDMRPRISISVKETSNDYNT